MGETSPWSCTVWREREGEERTEEGKCILGGVMGVEESTWVASCRESKI